MEVKATRDVHCTNNTRLVVQTDGGSGRQTNGRDTIHMHEAFPESKVDF